MGYVKLMNRIAVFGDVHGRLDMLERLHEKIRDKHLDIQIFSTGDLIDRGPNSRGVIQFCIDNEIKSVLANHCAWLVKLTKEKSFETFALTRSMGGRPTFQSYGINTYGYQDMQRLASDFLNIIPTAHKEWLNSLPLYRKVVLDSGEIYWIVHAGVEKFAAESMLPSCSNDDELMKMFDSYDRTRDLFVWARPGFPIKNGDGLGNTLYEFKDQAVQIFGHTIRDEPVFDEHFIAIDTGCGTKRAGQVLTAVILPEREFISVSQDEL